MLYFIVNPASKSGLGRRCFRTLEKEMNRRHIVYQAYMTSKTRSVKDCADAFKKNVKGPALLCVLGGDGTLNEAINATRDVKDLTYAFLPTGSSNDLARALGLRYDTDSFMHRITKKHKDIVDLGEMQIKNHKSRRFCVSCGIGYDAAVCKEALHSPLKAKLNEWHLGKFSYGIIAIKQILTMAPTNAKVTFEDGSSEHFKDMIFSAAFIHPFEGGGIKMAPGADCRDGALDLLVVAGMPKWKLFYLLPLAFFGLHTNSKYVHFYNVRSCTIETAVPLTVHCDGEYCGMQKAIHLNCIKDGLQYI
ncbi:MAG: YegS/Rv2252/BmrU family lipid kinase [Lachnospiraceae bacterium]|nr:YegS/Rv2252/BmrU family lipid kinase [Lachnospiraceae bacterium]